MSKIDKTKHYIALWNEGYSVEGYDASDPENDLTAVLNDGAKGDVRAIGLIFVGPFESVEQALDFLVYNSNSIKQYPWASDEAIAQGAIVENFCRNQREQYSIERQKACPLTLFTPEEFIVEMMG